jgi:hypothetical protein
VRGILLVAIVASLVLAPTLPGGTPPGLPSLTRIASKLAGLPAKRQPRVKVVSGREIERIAERLLDRSYPRDHQAYDEGLYRALGLLGTSQPLRPVLLARYVRGVPGLYDPQTRTVYVRRGPGMREALLRELVHALQDQAFDLRRLSGLRRESRDSELAAAAAVQGAAAFSSIQDVRSLASHGDSRVDLFLQLELAFARTTGARFAATLHGLGGRPAVFGALRRFPETTEQIFHMDAFLAREQADPVAFPQSVNGFSLVRDDSFGELDVRALLAVLQVPRLDHVGEGWGGGRTALYTDGKDRSAYAVLLAWDSVRDAEEWAEAVEAFVNEAFEPDRPGAPPRVGCGATACWNVDGRAIAFQWSGARTALVLAQSIESADGLARTLVVRS